MRRKLSAVLLAAALGVSVLSLGVNAEETEAQATEQVTEAESAAADSSQTAESEAESAQTEAVTQEEMAKSLLESQLAVISTWTDEQVDAYVESDDLTSQAVATNWRSVKEELGAFIEVTDAQLNEAGTEIVGHAKYEKLDDNTDVTVTYTVNETTQSATINWEVNYTMGVQMERAALNTVMGLGIVFLTLLFLSWLIGQLHIIPDMIEGRSKKAEPAAVPDMAPVAAPVVEEEELVDDLELVAVITAAIAAYENTSGDGFVVRSIKKANKRNWRKA